MLTIILVAVSLAMDCLAVSIAGGALVEKPRLKNALKIGAFFGLFQTIMPIIGWALGYGFRNLISSFDHWIAFGLLFIIGARMIYESFKKDTDKRKRDILNNHTLLLLAIATSIDALIAGMGLAFMGISLIYSVLVIGAFAFVLSVTGYFTGHKIGTLIGSKMEIVGGVVLIGIGAKILIQHLI
ncbi:MAG: manganese efflux pump MntP family protein [Cyanobacteria bacterium]|nr:manganese efflux pump MntP family protein [Cyanobacteriota bacterium]